VHHSKVNVWLNCVNKTLKVYAFHNWPRSSSDTGKQTKKDAHRNGASTGSRNHCRVKSIVFIGYKPICTVSPFDETFGLTECGGFFKLTQRTCQSMCDKFEIRDTVFCDA
jgi:hypothetical protein